LKAHLTNADLDRLEAYLRAPEREDTLPLDMLQGLLCAVISAPEVVMPSRWMPAVFGEDHVWDSADQAREITGLIMALHNDVARQLNEGEGFEFIVYESKEEGIDSLEDWCEGYLLGVSLADPPWDERARGDDLQEMLLPFAVISGRLKQAALDAGDAWDPKADEELTAAMRESLADTVVANRHYWLDMAVPESVRRPAPKVGRNEPCPCGSGKKFKNCCGRT
jgi:uncharacterized protein